MISAVASIIAYISVAQAGPDVCVTHPVGWTCQSQWIAELPQRDQRIILTILKGAAQSEARSRLASHVKTREDACWVATYQGMSAAMLSMAATKNPDVASYLRRTSETFRKVVQGSLTVEEATILLKARQFPVQKGDFTRAEAELAERRSAGKLPAAEDALIAFAKVAASKRDDCRPIR